MSDDKVFLRPDNGSLLVIQSGWRQDPVCELQLVMNPQDIQTDFHLDIQNLNMIPISAQVDSMLLVS